MMILQAVLEPHGALHIETTGEVVRCAPGVSFILADNSTGYGDETGQYEAVRRMNRATLDRMAATVIVDYLPTGMEAKVLEKRTNLDARKCAALVNFAALTRDGAKKGQLTHGVGLRRLISWAEALVDGVPLASALEACVLNACAPDDREPLRQLAKVHLDPGAF
jgi:MoxR-like ATPase